MPVVMNPASQPADRVDALPRPARWSARLPGAAGISRGPVWGWIGPLAVTAVSAVIRFRDLGRPGELVFDERSYVPQGWALLKAGHELGYDLLHDDEKWNAGTVDVLSHSAAWGSHPPGGKWMIGAGEWLFGADNPFGWRFSAALAGTLTVLLLARIGRRLLGSTLLGCTAGLLLAIDGAHVVLSRTGMLDIFLTFWVLAGFGCLLLDRDQARARLAWPRDGTGQGPPARWPVRWWLLAAGVCLGLACGVKWSGVWFVLGFLVLAVLGDLTVLGELARRRRVGWRRVRGAALAAAGAAVTLVPSALAAYLVTWSGWLAGQDGWGRQWAVANPGGWGLIPGPLRSLWHLHVETYRMHLQITFPHPYQAGPASWLLLRRPTLFFFEQTPAGQGGCGAQQCVRVVTTIGNPVLWWGGILAIGVLLLAWALRRDWRSGALLVGIGAGWLPWFLFPQRTTFFYYAVVMTPFLALAVTYVLGLLLGPPPAARRRAGALLAGAVVLVALGCFVFFYPVLTGELIPQPAWQDRIWLPSWK